MYRQSIHAAYLLTQIEVALQFGSFEVTYRYVVYIRTSQVQSVGCWGPVLIITLFRKRDLIVLYVLK